MAATTTAAAAARLLPVVCCRRCVEVNAVAARHQHGERSRLTCVSSAAAAILRAAAILVIYAIDAPKRSGISSAGVSVPAALITISL